MIGWWSSLFLESKSLCGVSASLTGVVGYNVDAFLFALWPFTQIGFSCLREGMGQQKERKTGVRSVLSIFQSPALEGIRRNPCAWTTEGEGRWWETRTESQARGALRWERGKLGRSEGMKSPQQGQARANDLSAPPQHLRPTRVP